MANMSRIRVPWTGGVGGAGLSTFYTLDPATGLVAVQAFFTAIRAYVPIGISWSFYGEGDVINSDDGKITGTWSATGQAAVNAFGNAAYPAPAGAIIHWNTAAVIDGHKVRGSTFLVPLISSAFDTNGTISGTALGIIQGAAGALVSAVPGNFKVFSRPVIATPSWTDVKGRVHPAVAARIGQSVNMISATAPDKSVVLRSRRD